MLSVVHHVGACVDAVLDTLNKVIYPNDHAWTHVQTRSDRTADSALCDTPRVGSSTPLHHSGLHAQIMPPEGYLAGVHAAMRAHGALCVADEVQCGFGRAGSHFWAFDAQGVVPDIVTLGKSIGNGFPMGAVVSFAAAC